MMPTATPAEVWGDMRDGNARFVSGEPSHPRQDVERRHELAGGQRPRAALFGCADSRLAAEIIFDQGLGDLFVVRNAGQVISDSVVGSLEYAVAAAAIESTTVDAPSLPPHIWRQIAPIVPAVRRVIRSSDGGPVDAEEVGREHLRDTVAELLHSSELISDAVAAGTLAIVGANYRLSEGTAIPDVIVGAAENP